eukprot:scaffold312923_cov43-Attheya_sp.AAC.1
MGSCPVKYSTLPPTYTGGPKQISVYVTGRVYVIFSRAHMRARAYVERQKQRRGCKGVDFGGKPHLLDAMRILKSIWEEDEGKYARVDGIKRCWRKANILPVSWECDINNDVGRSRVPISTKTLNKDDCDNICDLLEQLSVKAKESGVNVSREAHGLEGSLVSDGSFTRAEIRAMAENWVNVEDDPNIIDAE